MTNLEIIDFLDKLPDDYTNRKNAIISFIRIHFSPLSTSETLDFLVEALAYNYLECMESDCKGY